MKKKTYLNVTLQCLMQQEEMDATNCPTGVLSMNNEGFRFEETLRNRRLRRNPKLFDGEYVSMVRKQNGRYQCHLKSFYPTSREKRDELARKVYDELVSALNILD